MKVKPLEGKYFTQSILKWNEHDNLRQMPWKGEKDPYLIWLSEIILQQTRVEQGQPYFESFKKKYPNVQSLAAAPEDDIMKLWQGLGYYSRARNLHATAKNIVNELKGIFPDTFQQLLKLKGVGAYTAAAIASFAYDEPVAVVDGNVIRILARYFGIDTPFDTNKGKHTFHELAQQLISVSQPAAYNQAIMDFGATVCTPKSPQCTLCPLSKNCFALNHSCIDVLPVRSKKLIKKSRYLHYIFIKEQQHTYIKQRDEKDIWKKLYEFPLIETSQTNPVNLKTAIETLLQVKDFDLISESTYTKQMLTHQVLHIAFIEIVLKEKLKSKNYKRVPLKKLDDFAFPITIAGFLKSVLKH